MKIYGDPEKITEQDEIRRYVYSGPYKLKKDGKWLVNAVGKKDKKDKKILEFATQPEANAFVDSKKKERGGNWKVPVFDGEGRPLEVLTFPTKEAALAAITENNKEEKGAIKERKKVEASKERTFLEKYAEGEISLEDVIGVDEKEISSNYDKEVKSLETLAKASDKDTKLSTFQKDYMARELYYKQRARILLVSLTKFFLKDKAVDDEYIICKLAVEEEGMSAILYQLEIARKAIFKLTEQIHTANFAQPRLFEVLSSMQRILLDITKFQTEYFDKIEDSIKKIGDNAQSTAPEKEVIDVEAKVISTSNRAKLIEEINEIATMKDLHKVPKSMNKRLQKDGEDTAENDMRIDSEEAGAAGADVEDSGLSTVE
jgi:hypothetical protein